MPDIDNGLALNHTNLVNGLDHDQNFTTFSANCFFFTCSCVFQWNDCISKKRLSESNIAICNC